MAELNSCDRDKLGCKDYIIYYLTLYRKGALAWHLGVQGLPDRCLDPQAQGLGMKQRPGHQSWPSLKMDLGPCDIWSPVCQSP